jgi:hypothetical protein
MDHCPGVFVPIQPDLFTQICMFPFLILYSLPVLTLGIFLLVQLLANPASYLRGLQRILQQRPAEILFTLVLIAIAIALMGYMAVMAWNMGRSLYHTVQARRLQSHNQHGYGMLLTEQALVARLIDEVEGSAMRGQNCLWLPKSAITDVLWRQRREEGAKHARWVYRTTLVYKTATDETHWCIFRGNAFQTGEKLWGEAGDRRVYEMISSWWND